jgi:PKD repeat protein
LARYGQPFILRQGQHDYRAIVSCIIVRILVPAKHIVRGGKQMKHQQLFLSIIGLVLLFVLLPASTTTVADQTPPPTSDIVSNAPRQVTDNGAGFNLTLPVGAVVESPQDLEPITVFQIYDQDSTRADATKVEIAAERLPDDMTYDQWREIQARIGLSYEATIVETKPTTIDGRPALLKTIEVPNIGTIWEVEVEINQVVYRISTLHSLVSNKFYQLVLDGIQFTNSNRMQPNNIPSAIRTTSSPAAPSSVAGFPDLKFPFDGQKTITCAYNADDPVCHPSSKIALDFGLNYETVRAAHSGTLTRAYDSCGGNKVMIQDSSDSTYTTYYLHLSSYRGSTGAVTQGNGIAVSGTTGTCTTGPHLHFQLSKSVAWRVKPEPMCGQTGFRRWQTVTSCWDAPTTDYIVDDGDANFERTVGAGWQVRTGNWWRCSGWAGDASWMLTRREGTNDIDWAKWKLNAPAGWYDVYVYFGNFDNGHLDTRYAHYQIHHADGVSVVTLSQEGNWCDWRWLGRYRFNDSDPNNMYVYLGDYTDPSEYQPNQRTVIADAVKFSFAGSAPLTSISGQVTDPSGNPISGVLISASPGGSTTTDGNGNYTLANLAAGMYTLGPAKNGYSFSPASYTVNVPPGATERNFVGITQQLELTALEVTQAVQDLKDSVVLVEGKPTVVRAHVKSTSGIVAGVMAELVGKRNGKPLSNSPLKPSNKGSTIRIVEDPARSELEQSFYFVLPSDWPIGTVEFEFRGISNTFVCKEPDNDNNPNNNGDCKVQVEFKPAPVMQLEIVPIFWKPPQGDEIGPTANQIIWVMRQALAVFPVQAIDITFGKQMQYAMPISLTLSENDWNELNNQLRQRRTADGCQNVAQIPCKRYYLGILAPIGPGIVGMAENIPGDVASAFAYYDNTSTHELGHLFGSYHTDYNRQRGLTPPESLPSGWTYIPADGTISQVKTGEGVIYGFSTYTKRIYNNDTADLMSYGDPNWPSPFTYNIHLNTLRAKYGTSSNSVTSVNGESAIMISGLISPTEDTGKILSVYTISSTVSPSAPVSGTFQIRYEDSLGQALSTYDFEPSQPSEGSLRPFVLLLPWNQQTSRIVLVHNGQILDSRFASAHAPVVNMIYPNGGELLSGQTATVSWSGSDLDGDTLSYILQYSTDAGSTWKTLATEWPSTTLQLDLSMMVGTSNGLFRVTASDGFYSTQDQSDATFSVSKHSPQVSIWSPENDSLYVADQTIVFDGFAYDNEDGVLGDAALVWSSNLSGTLGSGRSLAVNALILAEGTHTITLTARDSDGQTNADSITIQIYRTRPDELPASLSATPAKFVFVASQGSQQTDWQSLSIHNRGDGDLSWSATTDQSWIRISSPSGIAPTQTLVAVDPTGLRNGLYTGTITITAPDADNSPQVVQITLSVLPRNVYLPIVLRNYTPLRADFVAAPTSGVVPLTVAFTNISTGSYATSLWDFGDGITSTLTSPTHIYTTTGTYTVTLTVSGSGETSTLTRPNYITVLAAPPPHAAFTASPTSGTAPLTVTFANESTGSYTYSLWDLGDSFTSTLENPTHVYTATGAYTVSLTISRQTGSLILPGDSDTLTRANYITVYTSTPTNCAEMVINGGFETDGNWDIPATAYPAIYTATLAHGGSRSLRAGIVNPADNVYSYSSAWQTVTIPRNAQSAVWRFWLYPTMTQTSGDSDYQRAFILDQLGNTMQTLVVQQSDARAWTPYEFELRDHAGETVRLYFDAFNNGNRGVTAMYVDDVSLQVCPAP